MLFKPDAQVLHLPVSLICGNPGERHTGLDRAPASPAPAPVWSRTRPRPQSRPHGNVPGHWSRTRAGRAPGRSTHAQPDWRKQETHRSGSSRSGPPCRSTAAAPPLSGCPSYEPGVIHDQHPAALTEALHDVVAHIVTDTVDVRIRPPQQALHPIRTNLASMLGQRPAVLPLQPRHVLTHPSPRLRPKEPVRHPLVQGIQLIHNEIDHHANMIDYMSSKCRCSIRTDPPGQGPSRPRHPCCNRLATTRP